MIDVLTADIFRYVYAALAMCVAAGFAMTLVLRWDVLHPGERILRIGLIAEHAVIIYGAYVALDLNYPPTPVGIALTISLAVVVAGFAVWFTDLVLRKNRGITRLSDDL